MIALWKLISIGKRALREIQSGKDTGANVVFEDGFREIISTHSIYTKLADGIHKYRGKPKEAGYIWEAIQVLERMKRWKAPEYRPHTFSGITPEVIANRYIQSAIMYEKIAEDERKYNEQRKREGKPIIESIRLSRLRNLRRAKLLRQKARRYQGVFSRSL